LHTRYSTETRPILNRYLTITSTDPSTLLCIIRAALPAQQEYQGLGLAASDRELGARYRRSLGNADVSTHIAGEVTHSEAEKKVRILQLFEVCTVRVYIHTLNSNRYSRKVLQNGAYSVAY
jgi:hypothetical protein